MPMPISFLDAIENYRTLKKDKKPKLTKAGNGEQIVDAQLAKAKAQDEESNGSVEGRIENHSSEIDARRSNWHVDR